MNLLLQGLGHALLPVIMIVGVPVHAQTSLQLEKQREQLLVSAMALDDVRVISDAEARYTAYHQHKEQVLTLDLELPDQRRTLLITLWDRDAGGVLVSHRVIDAQGQMGERREFVMYPLPGRPANRTERLRLPVMSVVDSGTDQLIEIARIDLQLTMQRIIRQR